MEEKDIQKRPDSQKGNGNHHRRKKGKHFNPRNGAQNPQNSQKPQSEHHAQSYRHVSADEAFSMHHESAPKKPQHAPQVQNGQAGQNGPRPQNQNNHHKKRRGRNNHHFAQKPQNDGVATPLEEKKELLTEETPLALPTEEIADLSVTVPAPQGLADSDVTEDTEVQPTPEVEVEKTEIVGVHFKTTAKVYYFDPKGMQIRRGTHVIVQTASGDEYGEVTVANRMIPNSELVLPLRPVLRVANAQDEAIQKENADREIEAYNICLQRIENHKLEMKLIDTELSFDRTKMIFYFSAEDRVDFRELVKELESVFHVRIEMRQIGIRDEAKMLGGLGICGRPFCCSTFLPDFAQVSIKMAKEQNLSLNSAKISGSCGRLMCCLRYEHSTYEAELKITPKVDSFVTTADGDGVVVESNPLTGLLKVRLNDEENTRVYARESVTVTGHQKGASRRQLEALRQQQQQNKQQLQQKREEKKAALLAQNQAQNQAEDAKKNQNPKKS